MKILIMASILLLPGCLYQQIPNKEYELATSICESYNEDVDYVVAWTTGSIAVKCSTKYISNIANWVYDQRLNE